MLKRKAFSFRAPRSALLALGFLFFAAAVFCQTGAGRKYTLYYYGVVTNVNDPNMLNITQDLFAAQIRGIDFVTMQDMRNDSIKSVYTTVATDTEGSEFFTLIEASLPIWEESILLFVRIFRPQSDEKWQCDFFAKNTASALVVSRSKEYDSYYKILTDAKALIQAVVSGAAGNEVDEAPSPQPSSTRGARPLGAENIAGTWSGEADISKIILMRSGRGFIVFVNGATMNVSVSLSSGGGGQRLRIVQQDKFNASYYPDIERKTILAYSDSAPPIEWNLRLTERGTLEGKKKTLSAESGSVEPVEIDVVWTKR